MMFKLLKGKEKTTFVKMKTQILMKQGNSLGVTIPKHILVELGKVKGDKIDVYYTGDGKILFDLKPKE